MRKYGIDYLTEKNDVSTDLYIEIEAINLNLALLKFESETRVVRRIIGIREIPNVSYPIVTEIKGNRNERNVNVKDVCFDKPLSEVEKQY